MSGTNRVVRPAGITQRRLLASVSVVALSAALIGGIGSPAKAAETRIDLSGVTLATGHIAESLPLLNSGAVAASVHSSTVTDEITATPGNSSTATVTGNALSATAIGNRITKNGADSVDLALLSDATADGIGVAASSINTTGAVVTSTVTGSELSVALTDMTTGTASNTGNSIQATTMLNSSVLTAAGAVPNDYSSTTSGGVDFTYDPAAADPADNKVVSTGSIAVSSHQLNQETGPGTGSDASLGGNEIALTLTPTTAGQTIVSSPELSANTLGASYAGNSATTGIAVETGGAPTLEGSVALSNVQSNLDGGDGSVAASNQGSQITAVVGNVAAGTESSTLTGTLSVSGNTISASSSGNEALGNTAGAFGNTVSLADGLNFEGAGTAAPVVGAGMGYDSGGVVGVASGDLALLSSQANVGTEHASSTAGAEVSALVQNLDEGGIEVSNNTVQATSKGNAVSSAILASGDGTPTTALFSGSAALASGQNNLRSPVGATVDSATISATVGNASDTGTGSTLANSAVTLDGNSVSAVASGNEAVSKVALGATNLELYDGGQPSAGGGYLEDSAILALGGAAIANNQVNYDSLVSATNNDATVALSATDLTADLSGSTLRNANGTLNAVAKANTANNSLSLDATTLSGGAALGNVQGNDLVDRSATDSASEAAVTDGLFQIAAGNGTDTVQDSTLELAGNAIRASAYGSTASNSLSANATNITAPHDGEDSSTGGSTGVTFNSSATDGLVFDGDSSDLPSANGAFALFNSQGTTATVTAEVTAAGDTPFSLAVSGDLAGSTVGNDGNSYIADAYANQASNALSLNADSTLEVDADGDDEYAAIASLMNVQTRGGTAAVRATASAPTQTAGLEVSGDATESDASVSGNLVQALAQGNVANANKLTVTGNDITAIPSVAEGALRGLTADLALAGGALDSDLAFTVTNLQAGHIGTANAIAADLEDVGALLSVSGDATGADLAMEGNQFLAGAYDNSAGNSLSIDGNAVTANGGVQNFQWSRGAIEATVGTAGTAATPTTAYSLDAGNKDPDGNPQGTHDIGAKTYTGPLYTNDPSAAGLPGWTAVAGSPGWYETTVTSLALTDSQSTAIAGGTTFNFAGTIPGTTGTPASPSVLLEVAGDVTGSTLKVTETSVQAAAVANNAANALAVTANAIDAGPGVAPGAASSEVGTIPTTKSVTSVADYAVSNIQQSAFNTKLDAEAYSTLGVAVTAGTSTISDSSVSASDNSQQAAAQGNLGTNTLSLDVTNTAVGVGTNSPTGAVVSYQTNDSLNGVTATSQMEVYAPGAMENSNLALSNNTNTALGVINDVTNGLSVQGTGVGTANAAPTNADAATTAGGPTPGTLTSADYVVNNVQSVTGIAPVTTTVATSVSNQDSVASGTSGIVAGTAELNGNVSMAQSIANRSVNSMALEADSTLAATGAVLNGQSNRSAVSATASGSALFSLAGDNVAAADTSAIEMVGNRTTAVARSNDAVNVLNASASAVYGEGHTDGAVASADPALSAGATYAVLNDQMSDAAVTATAQNSSYRVALNAGGAATEAVVGSSVSLSGNQVQAEAMGNRAVNQTTLTALASGVPSAAVVNGQTNYGAITASVTSATIGVQAGNSDAGVGGSSFAIGGNRVAATAVGNSVLTSISAAK